MTSLSPAIDQLNLAQTGSLEMAQSAERLPFRQVLAAGSMVLALAGCAAPQTHETPLSHGATQSSSHIPGPNTPQPTAAETVVPETKPHALPEAELNAIIAATGLAGLKGHKLDVIDAFDTGVGHFVIGGIDGAKPVVSLAEIKKDIAAAETLAAQRPSFTTNVQLGPNTNYPVTYEVSPSVDVNGAKRYIFFAAPKTDITALAFPRPGHISPSAYTVINPDGMNVSIIRETTGDELPLHMAANNLYTTTEVLQTCTTVSLKDASAGRIDSEKPDLSYVVSSPAEGWVPPLINIGREQFNNSWAFAQEASSQAIPYSEYKATAVKTILHGYEQNKVSLFAITAADYANLG